ncbi:ester cyclase [Halorussus aquaticus]|uniref:Ester cyclase n=1 Tax=Halorussus aquaticus TaxID=2953748 RepID=A0ABD5PX59_9EURY|nr:ester cyclase [Halorussus aquaticus]
MSEAKSTAEQLVRTYVDVWNERDYSKLPDIVSESFVMHDRAAPEEGVPGSAGEIHGPEGLEQFVREVTTGFPDFEVTILDLVSTDGLVMYEGEISMTHEGEFDGIPPTGRTAQFREMSKFRVADGAIREHRAYFDQQEIYEQLGLTED